jgi:hypothetical protein
MKHSTLVSFAWCAGALAAQAPEALSPDAQAPAAAAAGLRVDRVPVHGREGEPEYGIWAAGRDYKASFHGGMTFVPRLGRDYPHNQPVGWRTTSVRVGAQELWAVAASAAMTRSDYRVEYRSGNVVEAYDVLPEGLEQTFVLAHRPAAAGDLRVTGVLATALTADAVEAHHGDVLLRDAAGVALVRYGKAIAIDADGDRFAMTTTSFGNTITLQLPAASVAAADFPLVVDPLWAPTSIRMAGNVTDVGETDCASEWVHVSIDSVFAYTRHYSATDADVYALLGPANLTSATVQFYDITSSASADHARVAYVSETNQWVVVYQNLITSTQQMQLRAAKFAGGATVAGNAASVPHLLPAGSHEWRPTVGGVAAGGTGVHALVACQYETNAPTFTNTATSSVRGMRFDTSTPTGTWGVPFVIQSGATEDAERPSVNRAAVGGATFTWFVVCQTYANTIAGDDWDLVGRLVSEAGGVSGQSWISSLGTTHKLGPVVDGRSGRYCVAFATTATSIGKTDEVVGHELRCERLDWPFGAAAPVASGEWPVQTLQSNQYRILEANGIAHNGDTRSHWAIVWRSSSTAPALYATRVGYRGEPLQAPDLVAATSATIPGPASVLHDDGHGITTVCYMVENTAAELFSRVWNLPAPGVISGSTGGCIGGTFAWYGPNGSTASAEHRRIGSELAGPHVHGLPQNSMHLMLVGTGTENVPLVHPIVGGNCSLLVPLSGPDHLGILPLAIGAQATWQLPLPEWLPSMTLQFQDWVLDPANGLLWSTRRFTVPLVK